MFRFPGMRGEDGRPGDDNSMGGWPRLRKLSKDSGTESSCDDHPTSSGADDLGLTPITLTPAGVMSLTPSVGPGLDPAMTPAPVPSGSSSLSTPTGASPPAPKTVDPPVGAAYDGNSPTQEGVTINGNTSSGSPTPTNSVENEADPGCNNNSTDFDSNITSTNNNDNCQSENIDMIPTTVTTSTVPSKTDSNSSPDLLSQVVCDTRLETAAAEWEGVGDVDKIHPMLATNSLPTGSTPSSGDGCQDTTQEVSQEVVVSDTPTSS